MILVLSALPAGPQWISSSQTGANTLRNRSTSAASPPISSKMVLAAAWSGPRAIGQSTSTAPCSAIRSRSCIKSASAPVLMSTKTVPGDAAANAPFTPFAPFKPFTPTRVWRTSTEVGNSVTTMSHPRTVSAGSAPTLAPASANRAQAVGERS